MHIVLIKFYKVLQLLRIVLLFIDIVSNLSNQPYSWITIVFFQLVHIVKVDRGDGIECVVFWEGVIDFACISIVVLYCLSGFVAALICGEQHKDLFVLRQYDIDSRRGYNHDPVVCFCTLDCKQQRDQKTHTDHS